MILDQIVEYTKERVSLSKRNMSLLEMKDRVLDIKRDDFIFEKTLKQSGIALICEIKKASPSKGVIDEVFDYKQISEDYETYGADCISCLTEPKWFMGSNQVFEEVRKRVSIPMLRKDFIIDEYQIYESKYIGADSILLITSILEEDKLKKYIALCEDLGLSVIVETHTESEIKKAINFGARIVGVNNRNLNDFSIDVNNSKKMRNLLPKDIIFVAESGIKTSQDIAILKEIGANAVLIGEILMRSKDKKALLNEFMEIAKC